MMIYSALMLARGMAAPAAWWYSASRGASVQLLQRQWQISHSLFWALRHMRHLSILTVACIVASIAVIDGAFLQRASSVVRAKSSGAIALNLTLSPEVPYGFSAVDVYGAFQPTNEAYSIMNQWAAGSPISFDVPECTGKVCGLRLLNMYCANATSALPPSVVLDSRRNFARSIKLGN